MPSPPSQGRTPARAGNSVRRPRQPRVASGAPSDRIRAFELRRLVLRRTLVNEQWLGQRGLLAVGVIFVILAAGYLLKLSFDRGWISPLVRCIGGALAGIAVGAIGWRLHGRGTGPTAPH